MLPQNLELSIIVPVYNEKHFLREVIKQLYEIELHKKIIVVNDGSRDGSQELLKELRDEFDFLLIHHDTNKGKGAAIKTALEYITSPYVIIFDADLEYEPRDIFRLMEKSSSQHAVYGSRFTAGRGENQSRVHYFANKFLTSMTNTLFRPSIPLTDMETCLKLIPTNIIKGLDLKRNDFAIEVEITSRLLKKNIPIREVPIQYKYRGYNQGKKITFADGIKAVYHLAREWIAD